MKLKEGMIVKTQGNRKYWIVLNVTRKQWKEGVNCAGPGLYLFSGYWYGRKQVNNLVTKLGNNFHHKRSNCYGKIMSISKPLIVVGYARNSYLIHKLLG